MRNDINFDPQKDEYIYSNWLATVIDQLKPTNLYLYGGRGTAKSTDILASRMIDIIEDLPGAPFAFVADTYVNLITNILPAIFQGWERHGFYEHVHYVMEEAPPESWDKCSIKTFDYKHTIMTWNGCKFFLKSLDRPSINAGISVVHQFGDESKYLRSEKLAKFFPTLRGDLIRFGKSHYYLGQTFCSDMADPNYGESDWMDKMIDDMNPEQIKIILQTFAYANHYNIRLDNIDKFKDPVRYKAAKATADRWEKMLNKVRRDSTFFHIASSFVNADILTIQYFVNLFKNTSWDDFKLHVLSMKRKLIPGARFYGSLQERHFYTDGYNYDTIDLGRGKYNVLLDSNALLNLNSEKTIEAGFDAGNMMSLVIGQDQGDIYRIVKNFYTLTPDWIRELANQFLTYFKPHKKKYLLLYHDRAANQYHKAKKDFASQLKHDLEYNQDGTRSGWIVQLMSTAQGNINHQDKYNLMNTMMGEKDKRLPRILIDQWECKELRSQLEIVPIKTGNKGEVLKEKKSDKLPVDRLPLESTNLSDAFDYLICRKKWMDIAKQKRQIELSSIGIK